MLDRLFSAVVAASLALLVWLYARSRDQESLDNVPIPVRITLALHQAGQYDLEVNGPLQVPVSFTGPPARIRELRGLLHRGEVRVEYLLTVPEDRQDDNRFADTVRIEPADIHAPPGVTPMIVEERKRIPVTLHRLAERRLPVRLDYLADDRLGQVTVDPATVLVRGPKELLDRARTISTQPFSLPQRPEPAAKPETVTVGPLQLLAEIDGRRVEVVPAAVTARVTVQARQKLYDLADVPVHFLCPTNLHLRPKFRGEGRDGKVTLKLLGPAAEQPPSVVAFIDLTRGKFQPGLNEEPLRLQLPKDYQLAQNPPRSIPFELVPVEVPGKELSIVRPP